MTIKQQGGIFGRNPTFNDVTVDGELSANSTASIGGDATIVGDLTVKKSNGNIVLANDSGVDKGAINMSGGAMRLTADTTVSVYTDGSPIEGGSLAFDVTTSGNIAFPSGQGIDFSATSGTGTSELFDDYEEGSLSSLDVQDSSGNSASTSTKRGLYRKIGNMVFVSAEIYNVNTSGLTSGDQLRVYGLPYVSASAGHTNYGAVQLNDFTLSGSAGTFVQNVQGADYVRLQMNTLAAGGADSVIVSDAASGTADIFFSIAYPTD